MSQSAITTPKEERKKRTAEAEETLSKDYKKPKKLRQLKFGEPPTTITPNPLPTKKSSITVEDTSKPVCQEDIIRVINTLERVIARQDTAQGCIDRLISLCLQEGQEDSSGDEGVRVLKA